MKIAAFNTLCLRYSNELVGQEECFVCHKQAQSYYMAWWEGLVHVQGLLAEGHVAGSHDQ